MRIWSRTDAAKIPARISGVRSSSILDSRYMANKIAEESPLYNTKNKF
jgi:hypothetical protein